MIHSLKLRYRSQVVFSTILTFGDFKDEAFTFDYRDRNREKRCQLVYSPAARAVSVCLTEETGANTVTRRWHNEIRATGKWYALKADPNSEVKHWTARVRIEAPKASKV